MNLQERFEKFKKLTREEEKIISLIKENTQINENTKVLEVGSNKGNISKALQPIHNNITLVDIEEFDTEPKVKFVKSTWEETKLDERYDVIIATHVWGHFHHNKSSKEALDKMVKHLNEKGKLILCYNSNSDFLKGLIEFSKNIFPDFQYDYFEEKLLDGLSFKETSFKVHLKQGSFEELADLIQVLIIVSDEEFEGKKPKIVKYLKSKLDKPEFEINQKFITI